MTVIRRAEVYRGILTAALISFAIGGTARSQTTTGSVDLTAANTRYGDMFSGNSLAISPALHVDAPRAVFDAGGTYSLLAGNWSAQANAGASLFTPRISSLMGELAGYTSGSANADGSRTAALSAMARAHLLGEQSGVWLGAGGGRVWDGARWRNLIEGEAGGWMSIPYGTLSAVVTPSRLGDTIKYTDAEGTLSVFQNRVGIDLIAGFRSGSALPIVGGDSKAWGSASASYWVTSAVALIVSAGTYPVNYGQGFPGGRFVSAGVRIGSMPGRVRSSDHPQRETAGLLPAGAVSLPSEAAVSPSVETFRVTQERTGRTRFTIAAPAASRVEIAGDFSNWDPVWLSRNSDGSWSTALTLSPGIYEMNIRIDGGPWISPPGLQAKNDEFGQAVGLLIVPKL